MELFGEDLSLARARVNFLFKDLRSSLEDLDILVVAHVADAVPLVVGHNALRANHDLVVLAKVFALLLGVAHAVLQLCDFLAF